MQLLIELKRLWRYQTHLLVIVISGCLSPHALGDAGLVRAHTANDELTMTIFTSPTPVRVGLLDVSALLQWAADDKLYWGDIEAILTPPSGEPMTVSLTRDTATTNFMQAAKFTVDQPGSWNVAIIAGNDDQELQTAFDVLVAPALPRLLYLWPWFLPVPLVLALWAIAHRP